jgi:DNA polymerase
VRVTIDYETRSRADLKKTGAYKYAADPSTSVLCLAWRYEGDPTKYLWHPAFPNARPAQRRKEAEKRAKGINAKTKPLKNERCIPYENGLPEEGRAALDELIFRIAMDEVTEVEAHSAFFERVVSLLVMVHQVPDFKVPAEKWRCSAAKAAAYALPRGLDGATKALDLGEKKDAKGKLLINKLCKPLDDGSFREDVDLLLEMFDYCIQDVVAEELLSENLRPLIPIEQATWQLDQTINLRGVQFDQPFVEKAISIIEAEQKNADFEVNMLTDGAAQATSERDGLLAWAQERGYPGVNLQGDAIDEILAGNWDLHPDVRRVMELRRSLGRTSNKKFYTIRGAADLDGRVRGMLMFNGANTGRWAGKLVQPHNFPRGDAQGLLGYTGDAAGYKAWKKQNGDPTTYLISDIMQYDVETLRMIYGDPMELLATTLRGAIIAPPGRVLNVADYAAIEARITAWIAGQLDMLDLFRAGGDPYKVMAASIFGVRIEDVTPEQRQLGKAAILGLGFQMGAKKFVETCAKPPYNITITEAFAEGVVKMYRKQNAKIVETWRELNDAAIEAIRRGPGAPAVPCGKVQWAQRGRFLHCKLPSGRMLSYADPFIELKLVEGTRADGTTYSFTAPSIRFMGIDGKTTQWVRQFTYGGSLMENIVQATARDMMRDAMHRLEASGTYQTVLTVHDELVAESDAGKGSVHEFEQLCAETAPWAADCPIKSEGWRGERYRK